MRSDAIWLRAPYSPHSTYSASSRSSLLCKDRSSCRENYSIALLCSLSTTDASGVDPASSCRSDSAQALLGSSTKLG